MRSVVCLALLPLAACTISADDGGGPQTARTFALADFTAVALTGSDDVDVRVGPSFSVRAEGPARELAKLAVTRDGDTLRIGRLPSNNFTWGGRSDHVVIHVTMPRIAAAETRGSGDLKIDRVDGAAFSGSTLGSGGIAVAALTVRDARIAVSGSGDVALKGKVDTLDVSVAGSGDVDGGGLQASSAKVSVAGSGNVRAEVAGAAKVAVLGSGDVDLGKGARCTTSKLGSGEVRCGG